MKKSSSDIGGGEPKATTLVIDDIAEVREDVARKLTAAGMNARSIESIQEAITLVRRKKLPSGSVRLVIVSDLYDAREAGVTRTEGEAIEHVLRQISRLAELRRCLPGTRVLLFTIYPALKERCGLTRDTCRRIDQALRDVSIEEVNVIGKLGPKHEGFSSGLDALLVV